MKKKFTTIEDWYLNSYSKIFRSLRRKNIKAEDAEDITQDMALKILNDKLPFDKINLKKRTFWAKGCYYYNQESFLDFVDIIPSVPMEIDFTRGILSEQLNIMIENVLNKIENQKKYTNTNDNARLIFIKMFYEEMELDEIAKELKISPRHVQETFYLMNKKIINELRKII